MRRAALPVLLLQLLRSAAGDMYDLETPLKLPPAACANGCARWRELEADGSPQEQAAADAMWTASSPPSGAGCWMHGRAVWSTIGGQTGEATTRGHVPCPP